MSVRIDNGGRDRRAVIAIAAAVALATFVVYLPALRNGFVNWDDGLYVYQNPHIRVLDGRTVLWALTDVAMNYWHPVTKLSHALDYALFGPRPAGHHLTSILVHAVNAFLVVLLTVRLMATARMRRSTDAGPVVRKHSLLVAGVAAGLLFGIHPLRVESVAWVSERKDLLCALFVLLSIGSYLTYASARLTTPAGVAGESRRSRQPYLRALGFFLLALASKPMAVTLPLVLLLLDWYPLGRMRDKGMIVRAIKDKVPFALLGAVVATVTFLAQRSLGALIPLEQQPFPSRVLAAFSAIARYLGKMVFPVDLTPHYALSREVRFLSMEFGGALFLVAGITLVCLRASRSRPLLPAAWGFYLVTLFPVLGFVRTGAQFMADRFTYLPSLGPTLLVAAVAAGGWEWAGRTRDRSKLVKSLMVAAGIAVAAALAYATIVQVGVWKDTMTLWDHAVRIEPRSSFAYMGRGWAFKDAGDYEHALTDYSRSVELDMLNYMAYNDRGEVLRELGRVEEAVSDFTTAVLLNPNIAAHYLNRGTAYARLGEANRAIADLGRAIDLAPDGAAAYMNRGIVYAGTGHLDGAIKDLSEAIRLEPGSYLAYTNRGSAYLESGQADRALADYGAAVAIAPERWEAYRQRGLLYRDEGRCEQAIEDFTAAVERKPGLPENYLDRGRCYRKIGASELATHDFRKACGLGVREGCAASQGVGRGYNDRANVN